MPSMSLRQIRAALERKGFRQERSTNHVYYRLYVQGKATAIRTKVSHGAKDEVGSRSPLFLAYKRQLRLTSAQLERFLACPMDEEEYVRILCASGAVRPDQD